MPLASVGILLLGFVPTLGGPDRPLHWAMTAGMVGFGVLLRVRHGLRRSEGPLAPVSAPAARRAGRAVLITTSVIAVLVGIIMTTRWGLHFRVAPLSIALPLLGLTWLTSLGLRMLRQPASSPQPDETPTDRPSRRPSNWDALSNAGSGHGKAAGSQLGL